MRFDEKKDKKWFVRHGEITAHIKKFDAKFEMQNVSPGQKYQTFILRCQMKFEIE